LVSSCHICKGSRLRFGRLSPNGAEVDHSRELRQGKLHIAT
jgi:hypothetical protein